MDSDERTQLVQRIATYLNESEALVQLAFNQADGDIIDTLMIMTAPTFKRRLERELAMRQEQKFFLPR